MRGHGVRVAAKIFFNKKMEGNETFERGNYNTLEKALTQSTTGVSGERIGSF